MPIYRLAPVGYLVAHIKSLNLELRTHSREAYFCQQSPAQSSALLSSTKMSGSSVKADIDSGVEPQSSTSASEGQNSNLY